MRYKNNFEGIILAAGYSSRMNEWKPAIKINNIPMIIHSIGPMLNVCDRVILVGGYNFDELKKIFTPGLYLSNEEL